MRRIADLNHETAMLWDRLYAQQGFSFHQSLGYLRAYANVSVEGKVRAITSISANNIVTTALLCRGSIAQSVLEVAPVLALSPPTSDDWQRLFEKISLEVPEIKTIYFPLVYADLNLVKDLKLVPEVACQERLPTPTLSWSDRGRGLWERVCLRLGRIAGKRERRFCESGLRVSEAKGKEAVQILESVESKSWKARCAQDMMSRNQFGLYADLVESGCAKIVVVKDGELPVAYRLDLSSGGRVYCVKWSFDEAYRACSPGFYLLTRGLVMTYGDQALDEIDLYGSPDLLKELIETARKNRVDVVWPKTEESIALLAERRAHDARVADAYARRKGIHTIYDARS